MINVYVVSHICCTFIPAIKGTTYFLENFRNLNYGIIEDEIIISMETVNLNLSWGFQDRNTSSVRFGEFHEESCWPVSKTTNRGETGVDDKRRSTGV